MGDRKIWKTSDTRSGLLESCLVKPLATPTKFKPSSVKSSLVLPMSWISWAITLSLILLTTMGCLYSTSSVIYPMNFSENTLDLINSTTSFNPKMISLSMVVFDVM